MHRAKLSDWDVVILSDQLTIRSYSNPNIWRVGPMSVQTEVKSRLTEFSASSLPLVQQQALNTLVCRDTLLRAFIILSQHLAEQALVLRVCGRTRLNVNYAVDCLTNNAWNLEKAIVNFEEVKDTIPRDAFL